MKIQGSYFNIKKISYPNCDNHNGIFRVEIGEGHPIYTLQMIKECAQIMAHDNFILNKIKKYTHKSTFAPIAGKLYVVKISLTPAFKEGTGNIHQIEAHITDFKSTNNHQHVNLVGELTQIK